MGTKDPRIDAYIAQAAPFAGPILKHLRTIVHAGCPEVVETMKWSMPHFDYYGVLCGMGAFKTHCTFGFWKGSLIVGGDPSAEREAMGQFGRITELSDLPSEKVLLGYVRKAAALNKAGVKKPAAAKAKAKPAPLDLPDYFVAALRQHQQARTTFENLSYSCRKEYVEWLTEAKREATREQRLATTLEWLAEGRSRNWKYARC